MNFTEYLLSLMIQMQYLTIKVISESLSDEELEKLKNESTELIKDMIEQIKLKEAHENIEQGEVGLDSNLNNRKQSSLKKRLWR